MRSPQDYGLLATNLADMARDLLARQSVQETLDSIVMYAVELVNGCAAASIVSIQKGKPRTLAAAGPMAQLAGRIQAQLSNGPYLDATAHGQRSYRITDLHATESRWPHYVAKARELGVGSMMGFLLYTNDQDNLGALDLFSSRRGTFREDSEHVGWVLASHAAVALSSARHIENMDVALSSSRLIGEAIGIVMSRYRLTEDAAFEAIRRASQTKNIKVRELAETIIEMGALPDG